jgi:hypothetical protein
MKSAIIVLSDPKHGGEEALGRVFNALAAAQDLKRKGREVQVLFQGAGTRWPGVLAREDHPAHALYLSVADTVAGVSHGCAVAFGAKEEAERSGLDLVGDNEVPGTPGLPSLERLLSDGYSILTF